MARAITSEPELADREPKLCGIWPVEFLPLLDFKNPTGHDRAADLTVLSGVFRTDQGAALWGYHAR